MNDIIKVVSTTYYRVGDMYLYLQIKILHGRYIICIMNSKNMSEVHQYHICSKICPIVVGILKHKSFSLEPLPASEKCLQKIKKG